MTHVQSDTTNTPVMITHIAATTTYFLLSSPPFRSIITMDGVIKPLIPFSLYDFYYKPPRGAKNMKYDSNYTIILHVDSNFIPLNSYNSRNSTLSCSPM